MNMNNREIHTVLYNNNKNHRERGNYQDWRVRPVYGIFKSQREGENEVYGTLCLHNNMKRRRVKRSKKKLGWNCEISNDRNLLKRRNRCLLRTARFESCEKFFLRVNQPSALHLHLVSQSRVLLLPQSKPTFGRQICQFPHSLWQRLTLVMQFQSFCVSLSSYRSPNPPLRKARVVYPSNGGLLVDMGPQGLVKSLKAGPIGYVATPTTHHQLEERRWAKRRGIKENLIGKYRRGKQVRQERT